METTEELKAMDGKPGKEDGMVDRYHVFIPMINWAEALQETKETHTRRGYELYVKESKKATRTWTYKFRYNRQGMATIYQQDPKITITE